MLISGSHSHRELQCGRLVWVDVAGALGYVRVAHFIMYISGVSSLLLPYNPQVRGESPPHPSPRPRMLIHTPQLVFLIALIPRPFLCHPHPDFLNSVTL